MALSVRHGLMSINIHVGLTSPFFTRSFSPHHANLLSHCPSLPFPPTTLLRDETVTRAAAGVLGDIADTLGTATAGLFASHLFYQEFLAECLSGDDETLKETAEWAKSRIAAATGASS